MKYLIPLIVFISFQCPAQIESRKNNIHVPKTNIDSTAAGSISKLLEDSIVSVQLITLLPNTIELMMENSSNSSEVPSTIYTYQSVLSDSNVVDTRRLKRQATLLYKDQQELFQLLYGRGNRSLIIKCYMPHHGIQFLDRKGKTIGFIEICFDCKKTKSTQGFDTGDLTETDYKKLKSLFIRYMGAEFSAYYTRP